MERMVFCFMDHYEDIWRRFKAAEVEVVMQGEWHAFVPGS